MTLSERTEIVRKYAKIIFTKGSQFEQMQFLKKYKERYNKHWNFEKLKECIEVNSKPIDNMATIDKSIENINTYTHEIKKIDFGFSKYNIIRVPKK